MGEAGIQACFTVSPGVVTWTTQVQLTHPGSFSGPTVLRKGGHTPWELWGSPQLAVTQLAKQVCRVERAEGKWKSEASEGRQGRRNEHGP